MHAALPNKAPVRLHALSAAAVAQAVVSISSEVITPYEMGGILNGGLTFNIQLSNLSAETHLVSEQLI